MRSTGFLLKTTQEFNDFWKHPAQRQASLDAYCREEQSFVVGLLPEQAVDLPAEIVLDVLRRRYGFAVDYAIDGVEPGSELPPELRGPVAEEPDGSWLRGVNMVGINVRTVGNFWNVVKYALTLPDAQNAIHLLPIWEPGVVGSMYGISSWNLNPEFFSEELAEAVPALDSVEKQLRVVIRLLHLMGKSVGMDVIPHTDRFSQIALAFPEHFEWLQRDDTEIVDHRANLHEKVQGCILEYLQKHGAAVAGDAVPEDFFEIEGNQRMRLLFGLPEDKAGRDARRRKLIHQLYQHGYEPVPATMGPPFRGLAVDLRPEARNVDADGQVWRDFVITKPEPMSRVFGPLGRFKLYESKDDNANWELDFSRPRKETWAYVCECYAQVQRDFGFDFMRGDMSHVQMRPEGPPETSEDYYDILGAVKEYILSAGVKHFGYFAESFLGPRDIFGYGEEIDHLEAARAETTLGDLQSTVVGSDTFLQYLRAYIDMGETRQCTPSFTLMTADKDDPRFDSFYLGGNEVRLFIALFLPSLPSYMGLGFETRDPHPAPAPNEHYTKLYVFQESDGPKATHGPFVWGKNAALFNRITRLRLFADEIYAKIAHLPVRWLIPPDARGYNHIIAWTQADEPSYIFIANTDIHRASGSFGIPHPAGAARSLELRAAFTTTSNALESAPLAFNETNYIIRNLDAGEGRVYRIEE